MSNIWDGDSEEFRQGQPFNSFFGEQGARFPGAPTEGPYIGRSQIVKRGETVAVMQTMVVGRRGEAVTLCLSRRDHKPAATSSVDPPSLNAPLVAEIWFGAGAANERCFVDWLNGTLLTVPAGSCGVGCIYPAIVGSFALEQDVGVIIAEGIRPPSAGVLPHARFTLRAPIAAAGPGSAIGFVAPNRGIGVSLLTTVPTDYGSYELLFRGTADPNPLVPSTVYSSERPASSAEVLVPNGTRSIVVNNFSANPAGISLVFSIAL